MPRRKIRQLEQGCRLYGLQRDCSAPRKASLRSRCIGPMKYSALTHSVNRGTACDLTRARVVGELRISAIPRRTNAISLDVDSTSSMTVELDEGETANVYSDGLPAGTISTPLRTELRSLSDRSSRSIWSEAETACQSLTNARRPPPVSDAISRRDIASSP